MTRSVGGACPWMIFVLMAVGSLTHNCGACIAAIGVLGSSRLLVIVHDYRVCKWVDHSGIRRSDR